MLRHVTRVGGLCELHLNLAKWKQTKHIVCVRMKASLWRAVTEGFLRRGCGLSSDAGEPKSPFSKRSSQHGAQLHVWAKKSHRKKPITSQEYNSPLILSFVKNVHAPFARGLRHLGLSLDCFWRRFPCVQLFYLRLRMTSIRGKERRLRERLRCDRIAVRILCGCFFFFLLKKTKQNGRVEMYLNTLRSLTSAQSSGEKESTEGVGGKNTAAALPRVTPHWTYRWVRVFIEHLYVVQVLRKTRKAWAMEMEMADGGWGCRGRGIAGLCLYPSHRSQEE